MKTLLFSLASVLILVLPSCSTYPFGHSGYGHYFGGQNNGSVSAPRHYVPKEVQRQEPLF
jgi:hypothetical protein